MTSIIVITTIIVIYGIAKAIYDDFHSKSSPSAPSEPEAADTIEDAAIEEINNVPLPDTLTAVEMMDIFLKETNCQPTVLESQINDWRTISFVYQGGTFVARTSKNSDSLHIIYPGIIVGESSQCDGLTRLVDAFNGRYSYLKATISFDEEANKVRLDITHEIAHVTIDDIRSFVNEIPSIAHEIRQQAASEYWKDSAENRLDSRREQFLLREAEMLHQDVTLNGNPSLPLTIGSIIEELFEVEDALSGKSLKVLTQRTDNHITDPTDIYLFNIVHSVYDQQKHKLLPPAVISVNTEHSRYIFHLTTVSQSDTTVYIRLEAMRIPFDRGPRNTPPATLEPEMAHALMAYDLISDQQMHDEYRYMWIDAQDKVKKGLQAELTREQEILAGLDNDDFSEQIYRGNKLVLAKRYYEAILVLKAVYASMSEAFFRLNDAQKTAFFRVCYLIGFSYLELHQYERAAYYLQLAAKTRTIPYAMAYINALIGSKDISVFAVIDDMIESLDQTVQEQNGEPSDPQREFHEFLLRRRGYCCIRFGSYDTAEKIFNDLLEYPNSHDYAQSELNFINGLRNQK